MVRLLSFIAACSIMQAAYGIQLSCREDPDTRETICYHSNQVTANGDLRAFQLYKGGPNGVDRTAYTAVVNCKAGYMELRDKKGVIFARDQPNKLNVVQIRDDVCNEAKVKQDTHLR